MCALDAAGADLNPGWRAGHGEVHGPKHDRPVLGGHPVGHRALRVRHQAEDIARGVQHPGDVPLRSVRILHVPKGDPPRPRQRVQLCGLGPVTALAMGDRHADHVPRPVPGGERRPVVQHLQRHHLAAEAQVVIA